MIDKEKGGGTVGVAMAGKCDEEIELEEMDNLPDMSHYDYDMEYLVRKRCILYIHAHMCTCVNHHDHSITVLPCCYRNSPSTSGGGDVRHWVMI